MAWIDSRLFRVISCLFLAISRRVNFFYLIPHDTLKCHFVSLLSSVPQGTLHANLEASPAFRAHSSVIAHRTATTEVTNLLPMEDAQRNVAVDQVNFEKRERKKGIRFRKEMPRFFLFYASSALFFYLKNFINIKT